MFIEEIIRDQSFLFEEPAEDHTRNQANKADRITLITFFGCILWESDVVKRPEISIGQVPVELSIEKRRVERLLPSGVERDKVSKGMLG